MRIWIAASTRVTVFPVPGLHSVGYQFIFRSLKRKENIRAKDDEWDTSWRRVDDRGDDRLLLMVVC